MTRGQLVAELMELWEQSVKKLETDGAYQAAGEVKTAVKVLEQTYSGQELLDPVPRAFCADDYAEAQD